MSRRRITSLFIILVTTFAASAVTRGAEPIASERLRVEGEVRRFGAAELVRREGLPFLTVSGTPYEMGYQYGALLRNEVRMALTALEGVTTGVLKLVAPPLRPFARLYLRSAARSRGGRIPPRYRDELRGVADAAGVAYGDLLMAVFYPDLVSSLACTSIVVPQDGGVLHARNLDFLPPGVLGRMPLVIEYRPTGGIPYAAVGFVGALPGLTGMNDRGITISLNLSTLAAPVKNAGMPVGYVIRDILATAATIEDVERRLLGYAAETGWILTVGSNSEARGVVYDLAGPRHARHESPKGGYRYAENTFLDQSLATTTKSASSAGAEYNLLRVARVPAIMKLPATVDSLIGVLADTTFGDFGDTPGFFTINNYETVQSVIMVPAAQELFIAAGPAYAAWGRFLRYKRADRSVTVYREADARLSSPAVTRIMSFSDRLYEDASKISDCLGTPDEVTWYEVDFFLRVHEMRPGAAALARIEPALDRLRARYPAYGYFAIKKGVIALERKDHAAGAALFEAALAAPVLFPYDRLEALSHLARAYAKLGRRAEASQRAREALAIMDGYTDSKRDKKLRKALKRLVD